MMETSKRSRYGGDENFETSEDIFNQIKNEWYPQSVLDEDDARGRISFRHLFLMGPEFLERLLREAQFNFYICLSATSGRLTLVSVDDQPDDEKDVQRRAKIGERQRETGEELDPILKEHNNLSPEQKKQVLPLVTDLFKLFDVETRPTHHVDRNQTVTVAIIQGKIWKSELQTFLEKWPKPKLHIRVNKDLTLLVKS